MNHAVRRRSNDHDAQPKGTQILLVLKTPIHTQQDIETPLSTPKQLTVRRARPACGLHGADLVSCQLGGESTRQILVKQNAHRPERNSEPDRAQRVPVALRPTGTDRGTGRVSLPLPSSRTAPEPAPACRGTPACPPRFPDRCGRPRAHQPCDQHTLSIRPVAPHRSREAFPRSRQPCRRKAATASTGGRRRRRGKGSTPLPLRHVACPADVRPISSFSSLIRDSPLFAALILDPALGPQGLARPANHDLPALATT